MSINSHPVRFIHEFPADVLSALLSPTPGNTARKDRVKSSIRSVDWQQVAEDAESHAVGTLIYQRLADLDLVGYIPDAVRRAWKADSLHAKLQHILQRQDALSVSEILSRHGIRHAFIKGFAYREWFYDPPWVRIGGDADVLIDRCNVELARSLLRNLGFIQAAYSSDHQHFRPAGAEEIALAEANHHELAEFTKDHILINPPDWLLNTSFKRRSPFAFGMAGNQPVLHSSVDVHWAIHFLFACAAPLSCITEIAVPGELRRLPILSPEWNLIISGFKLYFEAFDRPRYGFNHLVDLSGLLELAPGLNWSLLRALSSEYRIEAPVFYTLSAAQRIMRKSVVPDAFLEDLSAMDTAIQGLPGQNALDHGDFIPYLLNKRIATDFESAE